MSGSDTSHPVDRGDAEARPIVMVVHPVDVLQPRLWDAWTHVSGLVRCVDDHYEQQEVLSRDGTLHRAKLRPGLSYGDLEDDYIEPAREVLRQAYAAAEGVGRWLHYGMADRAGLFETETRRALDDLLSDLQFLPEVILDEKRRPRWDRNVDKLVELHEELDDTAREPAKSSEWYKLLPPVHDALAAVDRGMDELGAAADHGTEDLVRLSDRLLAELIPTFERLAVEALPHVIVRDRERDDSHHHSIREVCGWLRWCVEQRAAGGKDHREGGTAPFEPDKPYRNSRDFTLDLLETLGSLLVPREADQGDAGFYTVAELAERHKVSQEALRKRLDRWRKRNAISDDYHERADVGRTGDKYFYREKAILLVIQKARRT